MSAMQYHMTQAELVRLFKDDAIRCRLRAAKAKMGSVAYSAAVEGAHAYTQCASILANTVILPEPATSPEIIKLGDIADEEIARINGAIA